MLSVFTCRFMNLNLKKYNKNKFNQNLFYFYVNFECKTNQNFGIYCYTHSCTQPNT